MDRGNSISAKVNTVAQNTQGKPAEDGTAGLYFGNYVVSIEEHGLFYFLTSKFFHI